MISILIPTYNYDCHELIEKLSIQCTELKRTNCLHSFEIIVADDASTNTAVKQSLLETTAAMPGVRWILNDHNLGRSRIRNLLLSEAKGDYVIFIDDDAKVVDDAYVKNYWALRHEADVICGDLVNPKKVMPGRELRYRYELAAEPHRLATHRAQRPYERFSTFNFFARHEVIASIGFNENIHEYGYEDVLMGFELERRKVKILHIDNPLQHNGIDTNAEFLAKTQAALRTLAALPPDIQLKFKMAQYAQLLHKWHIAYAVGLGLKVISPLLKWQLLSKHPSVGCFQIYKLAYYLNIKQPG